MEDVQNAPDIRNLIIDQVGIKSIRHPVYFKNDNGDVQLIVAMFNMYVQLPHHVKGAHMSRFIEILNAPNFEISLINFKNILHEMLDKLEAKTGEIHMSFPCFVNKAAPISQVKSLMEYDVIFIAHLQ